MSRTTRSASDYAGAMARWSRTLAAGALLLLAARFAWSSSLQLSDLSPEPPPPRARQLREPSVDLEQLKSLARGETGPVVDLDPNPVRKRELVVDFGPPRSEVFVNGSRVGRSPFAGHWACRSGDQLVIQIVPTRGAPQSRRIRCAGSTILARDP